MASLETVANLAGVSKTTVHRVLSDDNSVSPLTANVVLRAARKVGYVPRGRGKKAASSKSFLDNLELNSLNLGVLFYETRSNSPLTARLLHGFETPVQKHNLRMNVMQFNGSGKVPVAIQNNDVDGLIVRPGLLGADIKSKLPKDIPSVWLFGRRVGEYPLNVDCVSVDDLIVGQLLFNCLYKKGHRKIVIFNPWSESIHDSTEVRIDSFRLSARRVGADVTVIGKGFEQSFHNGLFKGPEAATAVYVAGEVDEVFPVYNIMQRAGLVVGRDVDLACCLQAVELVQKIDPNVNIVDPNTEQIAEAAVELLMWRLRNPQAHCRTILIEPTLIDTQKSEAI